MKRLVATEPDNPRRLGAKDIVSVFTEYNKPIRPAGRFIAVSDPKEAVKKAIEISITKYSGKMPVIITGSLYMMADIRSSVEETSNTFLR